MNTKIYDRSSGKIIVEEQYQEGYLKFLYHKAVGRLLLKLFFSAKLFSKFYALTVDSKRSIKKIRPFIETYNLDMSQYQTKKYKSFNEFFIRKIRPETRPYSMDEHTLISPADAKLMVFHIDSNLRMNIKHSTYTLDELIQDVSLSKEYVNGTCFVFRLTVDDYHRYHYIDSGYKKSHKVIEGVLHTVSPISSDRYKVYMENQREVSVLEGENIGEYIQIEVGAILVGRITNHKVATFRRGDEKGYFSFGGSTVILLMKENTIWVEDDIWESSNKGIETKVKMGEKIGGIIKC